MATTRRSLLKGVSLGAGSLLLSPILQKLQAEQDGVARAPKRVVFVLQSNGFQPWGAQPKGIPKSKEGPDKLVDLPLADYDLPADLEPLAPHIHDTTIIQRLSGKHCLPRHSGRFAALGGTKRAWTSPKAETIDAALARAMPSTYPLVNLGVLTEDRKTENGMVRACSAWGANRPIGTQVDPNLAYKALFGEAGAKIDNGGTLLGEISEDVKRIEGRLTAQQRETFAGYLDAFESLDQRRDLFQKAAKESARSEAPAVDERYRSTQAARQLEAQFELAGAALMSGLTNVVTIASGACDYGGYFQGLGFDRVELHKLGHFRVAGGNWQKYYTRLRQFHFELIAALVDKLRQASDDDGSSMMDNTLIVYTSDGADAHHSKGDQWPFVLVGGLGGAIRRGRFIEYPAVGNPANRTINALYCTLLQAAGHPRDHFNLTGETAGVDKPGPLAELLA